MHRAIAGVIKTVSVSRESTGKYYAVIPMEDGEVPAAPLTQFERMTGIDVGLQPP